MQRTSDQAFLPTYSTTVKPISLLIALPSVSLQTAPSDYWQQAAKAKAAEVPKRVNKQVAAQAKRNQVLLFVWPEHSRRFR